MLLGACMAIAPPGAGAQTSRIGQIMREPSLLLHGGSPGYLGVLVGDVDSDSAPKLKLKDAHGAVVTLIDHDAPAAQAGIRVNDVVVELNGQAVESAEQFGRMLRELPAGRKISLTFSRDGNIQTIDVQLVDHKKMEHDVWNKLDNGSDTFAPVPSMGMLAGGGGGDAPVPGGFHMPFFGSSLNVGALVEPLTSQMADYLGVPSGLMVKQVARKSEAAAAGLKAFDVILKVGGESIATTADWDRTLRANQGKPVQVIILRDRKQQTLTLQVDSKHRHAELEDLCADGGCPLVALLDPEFVDQLNGEAAAAAEQLRVQGQELQKQLGALPQMSQQQIEEMRKQAEALREQLNSENFHMDQKQIDQLRQQMEEFRKNFKPEDFRVDPKQMEELRRQMDELKREMQQMNVPLCGQFV
jgi:serine protease Do